MPTGRSTKIFSMRNLTPHRLKIMKTFTLYLCFITLGMLMAVPGPTLMDLQHLVGTDNKNIAFIFTARSIGYLSGALLAGVIFDLVKNRLFLLTFGSLLSTIAAFCVPWSRSLKMLITWMALIGLSLGSLDTGCNVYCLNMWRGEHRYLYQGLHFMFGIGGLIGPIIAAPFLGNYSTNATNFLSENLLTSNETLNFSQHVQHDALSSNAQNITYIYSIIGSILLLTTFCFLIISIISVSQLDSFREEAKSLDKIRKRSFGFVFVIILLFSLLIFSETGTEIGYAQMLTSYAVKGELHLSPATGSYMTSVFWGAFTVGRLASIFLAVKFNSFTLLAADIVIASSGALLFLIFFNHEWALWTTSVLLGVGVASFYPSAVSWLDTYINCTNKILSLFILGYATGEMVVPFTINRYIDDIPKALVYTVSVSCLSIVVITSTLFFILRKKEEKFIVEANVNSS